MDEITTNPRRHFITQLFAAGASAISLSSIASIAAGAQSLDHRDVLKSDGDAWMKVMTGKHRQIFHAIRAEAQPMLMAKNYLDAYAESYGAKPGEANAAIGFHGGALAFGFTDQIWDKYAMGKASDVNDPSTKAPATRNIFATGSDLSIDTLQKRGVVFLMCNTALRLRTRAMATSLNVPYDDLYSELSKARLPGIVLVPSLVVTLNRAQAKGFTYVRAS